MENNKYSESDKEPQAPYGYVEVEGIGIFDWGDEPIGFWSKIYKFLEFWKWDYRK